ncbi:serpin family protein [Lunatibacter salilacus]|uniref:serpin family protein n=1 Tax=Lunatibacter salilacus TaxID=2483804 RepID=UPI00131C2B2C|nr:serpin family protein [Lunatibacter salilacus]
MKKWTLLCWFVTAGGLASCDWGGGDGDELISPNIRTLQAYEKEMVFANTKFALDLFHQLEKAGLENSFYSPYSIHQALAMTMNGNEGQVLEEFIDLLRFEGMSIEEANKAAEELTQFLLAVDPKVNIAIANAIWYKEGYQVHPPFKEAAEKHYHAAVDPLDMSNPQSVDIINNWIENKTQGIIRDMLDFIPGNAVMYLVNAIYFKGDWKYQFPANKTAKEPFFVTPDQQIEVDMMQLEKAAAFRYYSDGELQYIEIPYSTGQYNMGILTGFDHNLDARLESFSFENLENWRATASEANFILKMPKFKMKHKMKNMKDDLKEMGLVSPFEYHPENFTRLFSNPTDALKISRVIHDAFIEVDEKGTEAAAATIVEILETTSIPSTPTVITLDKPFVFFIQENHSGALLFMGKLANPAVLN